MKISWANLKSSNNNKNNESVKKLFLTFIKVSTIIMGGGQNTYFNNIGHIVSQYYAL